MATVLPLSDATRKPGHFPIATIFLIAVNVFVFAREVLQGDAFTMKWVMIPAHITAGHEWVTVLTAMFMHGSWSHIIGNMMFLWAFGPEVEDAMNPRRFMAFYLSAGLVATFAQIAASPGSTVASLGASGAIAGVMGSFIVIYPRDRIRSLLVIFIFVRITVIPASLLIGIWFLTQLLNVGTVADVQTGGIAYAAHIGGFVFGCITARLFLDPRRTRQRAADDFLQERGF